MSRDYRVLPSLPAATLAVIALGGAIGAVARYGLASAFPAPPAGFPCATLAINVTGCLLIGVVNAFIARDRVRSFLGPGVLGGFTTFSTYIVGMQSELAAGRPRMALIYGAATAAAALAAAWAGTRAGAAVAGAVRGDAR